MIEEYIPRMDADDFKMRLRRRMAEKSWSANKTSLEAGLSRDAVRKLLQAGEQLPHPRTLAALAKALNTTEEYLLNGTGDPLRAKEDEVVLVVPNRLKPKYAEILGTAAGSHDVGSFQIQNSTNERVLVPEGIAHFNNVYAIIVVGDSMSPEHKPGETRFVLPDMPARLGDTVVVEFLRDPDGEPEAMIGHLLRRGKTIVLGKLNPENEIEIDSIALIRLHRIATYDDLLMLHPKS